MIYVAYQGNSNSQGVQGGNTFPPPSMEGRGNADGDKLGMFDAADTDGSGGISEDEYETLTAGISEIAGSEFSSSFSDYDLDEDGELSGAELKTVLDDTGFEPPPPPPQQVADAYTAQNGIIGGSDGEDLLSQLLDYLETDTSDEDIDIIA
tara:strand:- start:552 stop:1004 length:453 start_codon:yes stop_codon:yes gene_type:complete